MYTKRDRRVGKAITALMAFFVFFLTLADTPAKAQASYGPSGGSVDAGTTAVGSTQSGVYGTSLPSPGNVTVNFKDVEIKTVLHYLSEVSGIDIIPAPGVDGKVTMRLRDKPWETALDIVTRNYGYVYSREGQIIRVMPRGQLAAEETVTEVIRLSNLSREVELTKQEQTLGDEVSVSQTDVSIQQLMKAVNSLLDTKRGEGATFIPSVNSIVVTAIPTKMAEIKNIILSIDRRPPQIVLDAKVVEITLDKDERFGIDWNTVIRAAGAKRPITFPFTSEGLLGFLPGDMQRNFMPAYGAPGIDQNQRFPYLDPDAVFNPTAAPTANSLYSLGTLDFSTFTATLQLLDNRGDTEILSSPRITTLNNQRATIKIIDKVMLQKSVETTQTATLVTVEFEKEGDAREIGVKLTVIPQVNDTGEISVNLLPEVSSDLTFSELGVGLAANTIALTYSSREANTIVRVSDGETIFLGGLIRKNLTKTENKFPILGDMFGGIPVLGSVFKYDAEDVTRTEIVFFVTVHIVKDPIDSVDLTQTRALYDRYITKDGRDAFGDKPEAPGDTVFSSFRQGELKTTEKTETLATVQPLDNDKKDKKTFLDFRKKK